MSLTHMNDDHNTDSAHDCHNTSTSLGDASRAAIATTSPPQESNLQVIITPSQQASRKDSTGNEEQDDSSEANSGNRESSNHHARAGVDRDSKHSEGAGDQDGNASAADDEGSERGNQSEAEGRNDDHQEDGSDEDASSNDTRSTASSSDSHQSYVSSTKSYLNYTGDNHILTELSHKPWRDDEPPKLSINEDAVKHTATYYLPGNHGTCTNVKYLTDGSFHEIYELVFTDGWTCIGRFAREPEESLAKMECEVATSEYVRKNTTIPVPEIYLTNFNPNHVAGSAFVFMEKMEGTPMYKLWQHASTERKLVMIKQVAGVVAKLADTTFDRLGSLRLGGTVGPLIIHQKGAARQGEKPHATLAEGLFANLHEDDEDVPSEVRALYPRLRENMQAYLDSEADNPALKAPFRLEHGDFDSQNILFTQGDDPLDLKLSAVIDWDHSETSPLYWLCDYPAYIKDVGNEMCKKFWKANKLCRKAFVSTILHHYPKGSTERKAVRWCFREKSYRLSAYGGLFISHDWTAEETFPGELDFNIKNCTDYLDEISGVEVEYPGHAHGGVYGSQPDSEPESED